MMGLLRRLHAWFGLALCLLLVPLALSGALLSLKPEWLRATVPGAGTLVEVDAARAAQAMTAAEGAFPGLRSVVFAGPELGLHEVNLKGGGGGYLGVDGEVVQVWERNGRVVDWLFDLHHHLLAGDAGQQVAGIVGLLAAGMVITGVVVWWPARRSFRGRMVPSPRRAGLLAAHRDLGVIAAPLVLMLALTGAAMNLDDLAAKVMGFSRPQPPTAVLPSGPVNWPKALARAQARFPTATLRVAIRPSAPGKPAAIRLRQPGEWHANGRTTVWVSPLTGDVVGVSDALSQPQGAKLYNAFWPLHAAKVGGLAWTLVTTFAGLALAALSIYGAEAYRRRLFPKVPVRVSGTG